MPGNDSYTKLLLHCDGADASTTFADVSIGGAHGNATVSGNAQVDTAQSVFGGGSLLGDGTGDFIEFADHADWHLGSNDFNIDFRVRFNSVATAKFIAQWAGLTDLGWVIQYQSSNLQFIWTTDGTVGTVGFGQGSWSPSSGTWYHVAVDRSGNSVKGFIDGATVFTQDMTGITIHNSSRVLSILAGTGGENALNGWQEQIRLANGISRWTADFTPPTEAYSLNAGRGLLRSPLLNRRSLVQ